MAQHVVHFEIIGSDAATLRGYYADLFDWDPEGNLIGVAGETR